MILIKHKQKVICKLDPECTVVRDLFRAGVFSTVEMPDGCTLEDPDYLHPGDTIQMEYYDLDQICKHLKICLEDDLYKADLGEEQKYLELLYVQISEALGTYKDEYFKLICE